MTTLGYIKIAFAAASLAFSALTFAGVDTQTDSNGVILAGHDAVAYFTVGEPVLGSSEFTAVHNEAIYRFSSAENRDLFKQNPEKYEPMYGGFCAYGATFGKKFEIDGKAFEIVDGRLYVNKNAQVYAAWRKDIPKHLNEADTEWPTIEFIAANDL
ncbi:YHS domain-containing (seleno)protein [Alteromonas oceanisediminis]|uniref:YHS domain-containing (seleno)protein n=1 Tax=Alteromonas oceanisediminis TaxID=2836180 RepID=UPI001BD9E6C3|nr:YHS domain-containing (seleno)protein [Alteromonas oceanisediminis]MBT0587390.1 YHS domain protein [Alteromonas oceanisediminis]